jgi:hypothetical protein
VLLTPKEHYIAHLLLTELYEGKQKAKMCYALLMMCKNNKNQARIISAKQYKSVKLLISKNCSGVNSSFYGKKLSSKVREDISQRMKGDNNPSRKFGVWNKGKKLPSISEEHKLILSKANTGRVFSKESIFKMSESSKGKPKSEEHKKRLSEVNKGKKASEETKTKLSLMRKGVKQKIIQCPHCKKKKTGGTSMHRWHFENCKLKN